MTMVKVNLALYQAEMRNEGLEQKNDTFPGSETTQRSEIDLSGEGFLLGHAEM